jgi:hypothetical protein
MYTNIEDNQRVIEQYNHNLKSKIKITQLSSWGTQE